MLKVQYAGQTSQGALANQIGWINFGQNFVLYPAQNPVTVRNYIPGGYVISFQISSIATIEPQTFQIPPFIASEAPAFPQMPFGTTAYQGIQGYPVLVLEQNPDDSTDFTATVSISNICVTDCYGCEISNYTIYAADAEVTNLTTSGNPELWQMTTDGGVWQIVQQMPSYNNTLTGPVVTGVGTQVVLETGTDTDTSDTDSYVYSSASPDNLTGFVETYGGNQAFAFGIIINPRPKPLLLSGCCCQRNNYLTTMMAQTFTAPMSMTITTLDYNGQQYTISSTPVTITGSLATYSVTSNAIVATPLDTTGTVDCRYPVQETDVLQITYTDSCDFFNNQQFASVVFESCIPE